MQDMGGGNCPFTFNTDPATFAVGDWVSYRVVGMDEFPFAGLLMEVHDDYVVVANDPDDRSSWLRATREGRPVVREEDIV
jgi:hypothetical protein